MMRRGALRFVRTAHCRYTSAVVSPSTVPRASFLGEDADVDDFNPQPGSGGPLPPKVHQYELGVKRDPGLGTRYTRLGNPIPDAAESASRNAAAGGGGDAPLVLEDVPSGGASSSEPLGYDDEQLAARILEMQVDGQIDEAWQEGPRASAQDVASICELLRELKVDDVTAVNTQQKTGSFDFMVFGTCVGSRHIAIAAWAISEADKNQRIAKPSRQKTDDEWEVVTCGRIVVNLMQAKCRERLSLERKWVLTENTDPMHAARAAVSEGRNVRVHGLWTLTVNLQDLEDYEVDYCKDTLLRQR
jgi:ribosomal silencing factor RsfS